ncbi:MAG: HAMP domain-containing protein, partial [Ilumatobacter sp.]|uniref:HAMP domain-containing protein n=1 Tax=Ilumatobacter sp. TaxID=1967498 RepID=UPI0037524AD4|nr:HAMP domain-containing protein [Ilumatobacter sp.]
MRRRLVLSTVLVVTIVMLLLTVPVLLILREAAMAELTARTEQAASAVESLVRDDLENGQVPDLSITDEIVSDGDGVRIFDANGEVIVERNVEGIESPFQSSVVGPNDTTVQIVTSRSDVDDRLRSQAVRLGVIGLFAILGAALLAFVQARQLARPLERLARAATRLGDGDFTASPPASSGIEEIDSIARAIRLSGNRVERMLTSERGFTADATHQLRTGLTGLAMRLELLERHADPDVAAEANATLTQIHDLNATLDELLRVARQGSTGERTELDLVSLIEHHV